MSTATIQKIKKEVKAELKKELLNEFIMPILKEVKDSEGDYQPTFIRRVLRIAKGKVSVSKYNSKTFLKIIS